MNNQLSTQTNIIDPYQAIERSGLSEGSKRQYKRQIQLYLESGGNLGNANQLADYAHNLKTSPRAFLKSAIKLWSKEVERVVKSGSTPETVNAVLATIHRLDALNDTIKVSQPKGEKAHIWLTAIETKKLLSAATKKRDKLILALLVGAGLRRDELINLRYENVVRQGERMVLDISHTKGSKARVVPISSILAEMIEASKTAATRPEDKIICLSGQGVADVVKKYGAMIGKDGLMPHDLRRSYAEFGLSGGIPLTQISRLLGHANLSTTQRYLNMDVNLEVTISDFVPLA